MKVKIRHNDDGTADREEFLEDGDTLIEHIDFRDGEKPTMAEKRQHVAAFQATEKALHERAFRNYFRGNFMSPEEKRTMSTTTDAQGGWIVAESFANDVLQSESQTDEINQAVTLLVTAKGNPFNYPILGSATATALATAQNAQTATSSPLVVDQIAFGECPTPRVDDIVAPRELVEDSASPMERIVAREGGARLARYDGAAAVAAIKTACDVGVTAAATNAITADEILDLIGSVNEKYAANGAFLLATSTLVALRKLKSTSGGSYLLPFGKDASGRKTLFDFPIYICPSMDTSTVAGNKPVAFGALDRVLKRVVKNSLTLQVLLEKYATPAGQIGYSMRQRMDFKVAVSANGPMPIRFLQMHA